MIALQYMHLQNTATVLVSKKSVILVSTTTSPEDHSTVHSTHSKDLTRSKS